MVEIMLDDADVAVAETVGFFRKIERLGKISLGRLFLDLQELPPERLQLAALLDARGAAGGLGVAPQCLQVVAGHLRPQRVGVQGHPDDRLAQLGLVRFLDEHLVEQNDMVVLCAPLQDRVFLRRHPSRQCLASIHAPLRNAFVSAEP